jgi:hypothetical protein
MKDGNRKSGFDESGGDIGTEIARPADHEGGAQLT